MIAPSIAVTSLSRAMHTGGDIMALRCNAHAVPWHRSYTPRSSPDTIIARHNHRQTQSSPAAIIASHDHRPASMIIALHP
jgi:hypothetical protein